jgi:hypothetical protein
MEYNASLHWFGLVGFIIVVILLVYDYTEMVEKKQTAVKWPRFLKMHANDFVVMLIFGQLLVFLQEFIANGIYSWFYYDDPDFWIKYYDSEEIIAVILGLFGLWIIRKFFKVGVSKLERE